MTLQFDFGHDDIINQLRATVASFAARSACIVA